MRLVMVPGQENHVRTLSMPRSDLFDHLVLRGAPIPRRAEIPTVDDVSDQIQVFCLVVPQKAEKTISLARTCAKMEIRYPDRAMQFTNFRTEWASDSGLLHPPDPLVLTQPAISYHLPHLASSRASSNRNPLIEPVQWLHYVNPDSDGEVLRFLEVLTIRQLTETKEIPSAEIECAVPLSLFRAAARARISGD